MLSQKMVLVLICLNMLCGFSATAQGEISILPVYNPSHLQIKVSANGKCLTNDKLIYIDDKNVEIKAFSIGNDAGAELVIPEIDVDLVRGGRLVASEKITEEGDISNLLKLAKGNDVLRFMVNGVYIKNAFEKLELYSAGTVNLLYSIVASSRIAMD
jgi:hypothetical protein